MRVGVPVKVRGGIGADTAATKQRLAGRMPVSGFRA